MKHIIKVLFLFISLIAIVSCSKKSNSKPASYSIVGTWHNTADTVTQFTNGVLTSTEYNQIITAEFYQYNADSTGVTPYDEYGLVSFTYSVAGNQLTVIVPNQTVGSEVITAYNMVSTIKWLNKTNFLEYFDETNYQNGNKVETKEEFHWVSQ